MAFPKTQSGSDLMLEAPSAPEPNQYEELGLRFVGRARAALSAGPPCPSTSGGWRTTTARRWPR